MNKIKGLSTYIAEAVNQYRTDRERIAYRDVSVVPTPLLSLLRWLTPNGGSLLLVITLIATAQVWARPLANTANAPGPSATTINYQGRLADSAGNPLMEQGVALSFAIYDAEVGGNLIWPASGTEDHVVDVLDGLFSVGLA